MAGALMIKTGTKLRMAFDVPAGQDPKFNMICTFHKAVDESAFLVSIPMVGGKALLLDENQKFLFQCGEGDDIQVFAGYADYTEVETMPKLSFKHRRYHRFPLKISA